jgi:hypothetical protein
MDKGFGKLLPCPVCKPDQHFKVKHQDKIPKTKLVLTRVQYKTIVNHIKTYNYIRAIDKKLIQAWLRQAVNDDIKQEEVEPENKQLDLGWLDYTE